MNFIKRLFCRHRYEEGDMVINFGSAKSLRRVFGYAHQCVKCGNTVYTKLSIAEHGTETLTFSEIKIPSKCVWDGSK